MGNAPSTPPPLVAVNAPGGRVLVPPGSALSVHPPAYTPLDPRLRRRGMNYPGAYYRHGRRKGMPFGAEINVREKEESEFDGDEMEGLGYERFGRGGMGGGGRVGMGMGSPRIGTGRRRGAWEGMPMSPGMNGRPMDVYPGMMSPRVGGAGMGHIGSMGGIDPGMMGRSGSAPVAGPHGGGMPGGAVPPLQRYNVGMNGPGMPGMKPTVPRGADHYAYANPPPPSETVSVHGGAIPPHGPSNSRSHGHIPMGMYTKPAVPSGNSIPRPTRRHTDPASMRLNRTQPSSQHAGPSGHEWVPGDTFLDACTCTTNCTCRKSMRVLYRDKRDAGSGEEERYTSGEIRYVLRDDLGKDCGDHSGCWKKGERKGGVSRNRESSGTSSDSSVVERKQKAKAKEKKEREKDKAELKTVKKLLRAMDGKIDAMKSTPRASSINGNPMEPGLDPRMTYLRHPQPQHFHQAGFNPLQNPYALPVRPNPRMPPGTPLSTGSSEDDREPLKAYKTWRARTGRGGGGGGGGVDSARNHAMSGGRGALGGATQMRMSSGDDGYRPSGKRDRRRGGRKSGMERMGDGDDETSFSDINHPARLQYHSNPLGRPSGRRKNRSRQPHVDTEDEALGL